MRRRIPAISLAVAAAVFSLAVAPSAVAAAVTITTSPALFPSFDPTIVDYGVQCQVGKVTFSGSGAGGAKISIAGGVARATVAKDVSLTTGQSFSWVVSKPVGTRTSSTRYHARCVPGDMSLPTVNRSGSPTAAMYLMSMGTAPTLDQDLNPITTWYSALFDGNGVPLWWFKRPFVQLNPTILNSKTVALWVPIGHPNPLGDFGFGRWQTYEFDGTKKDTISAPDPGYDIHEIQPGSTTGRYLTVTYRKAGPYDLTPVGGPRQAWGYRAVVQEVTADGKVKWQWDAASRISVSELSQWWTDHQSPRRVTVDELPAFDLDHISSARLDGTGVILAFRHLDALYRVSKASGRILWKLGGTTTPQSLKVIGDPRGDYPIGAPHDALPLSGGRVAMMDVGLGRGQRPRMVIYRIDSTKRTATFLSQIESPIHGEPICCGSARPLKSGNWAISWPGQALAGEYRPGGTPVLEFALPPRKFSYRMQPIEAGVIATATLRTAMDWQYPR